ncbi:sigma-70 family RNA polymerase sigma factor [Luteimonas arsenica]|uniref:sigma-70 family RNA polymerase sigma factor n=1 Tax=Luteimonas arsenica TaxID=1586242 RepID=UPI001054C744|nr:sigma-70 family RNA polymerase sigma factor [Luteimonas arsenica]
MTPTDPETFPEERRAFLLGLAYRLLGSYSEAEDAVQDTFLKWNNRGPEDIDNPAAWLTAACTRRCIDLLRAARKSRTEYIGAWLPEPIQTAGTDTPESEAELSSSLSMAFLLLLERLAPKERAAYLLHEILDRPYSEVALALGVAEPACRKLVSRAKAKVGRDTTRRAVPRARQEALLTAFRDAVDTGSTGRLVALMSEDIRFSADGGGKVPTLLETLAGRDAVLESIPRRLRGYRKRYDEPPMTRTIASGADARHRAGALQSCAGRPCRCESRPARSTRAAGPRAWSRRCAR